MTIHISFIPFVGVLFTEGGGRLQGTWQDGELTDRKAVFTFPHGGAKLYGEWRNGEMKRARYESDTCCGVRASVRQTYQYEPSTDECFCLHPLLADPYESERVCVRPSSIPGAEEGLFTTRPLVAGEVAAFYNGVRVPHKIVDRRPWRDNSNCISLDETYAIDVPLEYASTSVYCASLGHKANHAFGSAQNAEYALFWHPRWGDIKCVRAIRDIPEGEEVLVAYGYAAKGGPEWYKQARKAWQNSQQQQQKEEEDMQCEA